MLHGGFFTLWMVSSLQSMLNLESTFLNCRNCESSVCDATPLSPKQEIDTKIAEEVSGREWRNFGGFILRNPSFLSLAEEIFYLNMNRPTILKASSIYNFGESDRRLFVDSASELRIHK